MDAQLGTCPLTQRQLVEEYFIEHRTKILDLAAYLDRLDRARELDAQNDFRLTAFRQALQVLSGPTGGRMQQIQMILSDPRSDLLDHLDRKSAFGAFFNPGGTAEAR
jgi:hypothetical protein